MDDVVRSPLADRTDDLAEVERRTGGGIAIAEVPFLAQVDVRVDPAHASRLPSPPPLEPNTWSSAGDREALWLGPDEWLVVGPPGAAPAIVAELEAALDGAHRSVVDVSAGRAAVELRGEGSRDLLSKGCSLDLHPRSWKPGMCAQSLLARVPVILQERADATRVFVRPSFADYLVDWLVDAAGAAGRGSPGPLTP